MTVLDDENAQPYYSDKFYEKNFKWNISQMKMVTKQIFPIFSQNFCFAFYESHL